MLSSLRYNFRGNWCLFGKNIFHVQVLIFNKDIRLEIEYVRTYYWKETWQLSNAARLVQHNVNKNLGFSSKPYYLTPM